MNKISNYFSRSEDNTKVKMTLAETGVVNSNTRASLQAGVVRVQGEGMVKDGQQRRVGDMNETKKTFSTVKPKKNEVKKKIEQFTKISKDSDNCLIGSGRCATHNTKVMRVMVKKRVSVQYKDGSVGWQMCEGTTLSCPAVNPGHSTGSCDVLSEVEAGVTNKRARVYSENWTGESEPGANYDVMK